MAEEEKDNVIRNNPFTKGSMGDALDQEEVNRCANARVASQDALDALEGKNIAYKDQLKVIRRLYKNILPELMEEMVKNSPSADRSVVAARASGVVKDISLLIIKEHESELAEELDLNNPKLQKIMEWFLDLFRIVLHAEGLDTTIVNNVFTRLQQELIGWEEKSQKRLKGISSKALSNIENPLVEKVLKPELPPAS